MTSLGEVLSGSRYESYTYSYPHKTAYRPLKPPVPLDVAWSREDQSALFLYLHVPFCEMRCGFCNLFTQVRPKQDLPEEYVSTVTEQARRVRAALRPDARFARVALGGGTPTYLAPGLLSRLFDVVERIFETSLSAIPASLETSPETATPDRLELARQRGIDRLSIGIESFSDAELKALGRPQTRASALAALERIRDCDFPTLNIDLIYGAQGMTEASWLESIRTALSFEPEELYLYPLYVRPLTGLGRRGRKWPDMRPRLYELGRDLLCSSGYEQVSLRMFRRAASPSPHGPIYCCQEDGMVGLGCGARSYTRSLHYSDEWAVGASSVRGIIADYVARPRESFSEARYGFVLDSAEQRRRYVIQSISIRDGLSVERYRARFGADVLSDFPELAQLAEQDLLAWNGDRIEPTARGLAWSDAIGPWLYSTPVRERMQGFDLR